MAHEINPVCIMRTKGHPLFSAAVASLTTNVEWNVFVLDHVPAMDGQRIQR
jgi:hypothetical protein